MLEYGWIKLTPGTSTEIKWYRMRLCKAVLQCSVEVASVHEETVGSIRLSIKLREATPQLPMARACKGTFFS
jgi:hypothetical protein